MQLKIVSRKTILVDVHVFFNFQHAILLAKREFAGSGTLSVVLVGGKLESSRLNKLRTFKRSNAADRDRN